MKLDIWVEMHSSITHDGLVFLDAHVKYLIQACPQRWPTLYIPCDHSERVSREPRNCSFNCFVNN